MKFSLYFFVLCFVALGSVSRGSNYPSNYGRSVDFRISQQSASVRIDRKVQFIGAVELEVIYSGKLKRAPSLTLLIIVHYRDGSRQLRVPMEKTENGYSAKVTNGCLVGELGGCKTWSSNEMKHLLYWANYGTSLNGLDIEVAFDAGNGVWDSGPNSSNYQFLSFPSFRL